MKIKGVAFDLEGTLVDVEWAHHEGHIYAAREVGVHLTLKTAISKIPHFIGGPDEKIAEEIWQLSDKGKSVNEILGSDTVHFHRFLEKMEIKPRIGVLEVIAELRRLKIAFAVGSLDRAERAYHLLDRSGIRSHFDHIVLREDVELVKPAPDVYLKTAERMGIEPSEQLVFEDSPRGVIAAIAAGSMAIGTT